MTTDEFRMDAMKRSKRRIINWYNDNLMRCLEADKEKRVRDIDTSIALANQLLAALNEPRELPKVVPLRNVEQSEHYEEMKPIEPRVRDILMKGTEKGADVAYLKERNKKSPEEKYYFRVVTSWDYGWQQHQSKLLGREVHAGRCAILRDTFYRKNNPGPDPDHYRKPSGGGTISICSNYECP